VRELQAEIRSIVADWGARVSARFAAGSLAAIDRDASTRAAQLVSGSDPGEVLRNATRGVSYEPPPWIRSIVIVPTVAMRPYIIPVELRDTVVFLCSVADEAFETDPSAPPQRLVKVAAALGDERRLRILRLLRGEALTASEIADRMGVDRTSLHHHLGILRSAGLLAIRDEGLGGWRYALREDAVEHLGSELVGYLRSLTG
jgi:DNA-binding transcriptional ArsR family regulator